MRRAWSLAVLLIGCGAPAPQKEAAEEPATVTVDVAPVAQRNVQETLPIDGNLVLPEGASSRLAPGVTGALIEVRVKEGDRVNVGELLARIDPRALVAQRQSAAAGASSAAATAAQAELALKAAQADQASAVQAARLALDVAVADGKASVDAADVDIRRLRAGARPQEITQAQQTVDQATIARNKARLDADRDARLLAEGLVAGSQADASAAALQNAESILRSAQAALDLVRAGTRPEEIRAAELRLASTRQLAEKKIEQARAALRQAESGRFGVAAKGQEAVAARLAAGQKAADARAAQANASAGELRSPMTGYVVRRFLNPGDTADPATPVLALSAVSPSVDFVGSLSPAEASKVEVGMRIVLGHLAGKITSIGQADPTTGLVSVRAHLAGAASAGGFATGNIVLTTLRHVAVVPKGAVVSRSGKDVVFVARDGTAHLSEVQLGPEQEGLVAVKKGVRPGDQVVVLGGNELADGAKIEAAKKP